MNNESLLRDDALDKLEKWRKILQKVLIGIVIGEFVFGAILILAQGKIDESVGKIAASFLVVVFSILFIMSNLKCISKKQRVAQIFSFVSLGAAAVWTVLSILGVWEVIPMMSASNKLEPLGKFEGLIGALLVYGLIGAWIAVIKENGGPIKVLKITAISCLLFCLLYTIVVLVASDEASIDPTFTALSGLASLALIVTWCMAYSISKRNSKEEINQMVEKSSVMSDEEVQKKIQEEVQRQVEEALKNKENKQD